MADFEKVFDLEATLGRLGGDESLLGDMVRFFIEDSPGLLTQIAMGIRNSDANAIERAAHSLKGLSLNFGGEQAVQAARKMEQFGNSKNFPGAVAAEKQLGDAISRLQRALLPFCADSLNAGETST